MAEDTSRPSSSQQRRKKKNEDQRRVTRKARIKTGSSKQGVEKYFFFIKEEVSSHWEDLATKLGIKRGERENIASSKRNDKSRCMELLEVWHNRNGKKATIEVLMAALSEANLQRTVDELKYEHPELHGSTPVLPVRAELGMVPQKSDQGSTKLTKQMKKRLWELERELFTAEVLMDAKLCKKAEKAFLRHKAFMLANLNGSVIFLLTFVRQTDVDRFYHNHYRVGEGTLSQQLSHILIPDKLHGTVEGTQLIVRLHVKHEDYLRVRNRLGQGLNRTTSLDNIPALPSHARRMEHSLRRGLDLAMVSEGNQSSTEGTEDVSTLTFTVREVQTALQTGREKSQQQTECRLQAIQGELGTVREETIALGQGVTKLTQDQEAQKIITEIQQLQATNRNKEDRIRIMQHQIDASRQQTETIVHNLNKDVNRLKGDLEEAQKSLLKQRLEIQQQHETNKSRGRRLETMLREKEQSEAMVRSLKRELSTLKEKDKKSQATLQKQKLEIQQLLETNKNSKVRIDELTTESTKLQTDILKLSEEVQLLKEKDETSQQILSEQKQEIHQIQEASEVRIDELTAESTRLQTYISKLSDDIRGLREKDETSQQVLSEQKLEINQLRETNKSSEVRIDELTAENIKLQTDILKLSEEVQELRQKDETSQKVLSEQRLEIHQLQEVNKSSESRIDQLTAEITELQTDTRKRSEEIRELTEKHVTSQNILSEQRLEIQQLEETIRSKEAIIKILHTDRQQADATVHSQSKKITSLKEEIEEILQKQKSEVQQLQEANKIMADRIKELLSAKQPLEDKGQGEGHEREDDPKKEETKTGLEYQSIGNVNKADSGVMAMDRLYRAVVEGDVQTVRRGLKTGVDVNGKRDWGGMRGQTLLHVASRYGQTGVSELLIQDGSDVKSRDDHQSTALHLAAAHGHTGNCELLIRSGAKVKATDKSQLTALHDAAAGGHTETCELLIRAGADPMATDKAGNTPLDKAGIFARQTRRVLWDAMQERSYHELLQKSGGVKVNRCRVVVFGMTETGKSTLKKSLRRGPVTAFFQGLSKSSSQEPHDPTPGVDIETFHIPGVGEVSVWDFAGQAEYAVTPSMFMDAENTVFIVLYNIMDDTETQERQVHWWLCFIKSCNPNRQPDVILVASHADQVALATGRRQATRVVQTMKAEFKDHLRIADEVILMDCRQTRAPEMDRLKSLLVRMREALLQHQRDMPRLCAEIMNRLPEWCKKTSPKFPVMMWRDVVEEVRKLDRLVTEDFLLKSTWFLHHSGEVLFITPATSDPILVLKPNWLCTDVFGRLMALDNFENRLYRTSEDYVTREELQRVFQDVAYVDLVIDLLQEFQLCHSYNGLEFIFPGLLTQTMPSDKWQPTPEPKVVYFGKQVQCAESTDMFSSGFFPRVQTRLMRELENHPLLWRDGAKCVDKNVEGLIKLSPDGRAVNICVRSAQGDKVQCGKMLQQLENIIADHGWMSAAQEQVQ